MSTPGSIHEIPDNHTVDFITPEIYYDDSYLFRKVYLPAALIRLSRGENLAGEGEIHMTGRGVVGYHEARDYSHVSPEADQTLKSLQGKPNDQIEAARAFDLGRRLPNIAQVIGLQIDISQTTDHYYGKYYTVDSADVSVQAVDSHSRMGLYRLLGEPAQLDWLMEDVDPDIETALQLRHIGRWSTDLEKNTTNS